MRDLVSSLDTNSLFRFFRNLGLELKSDLEFNANFSDFS